MLLTACSAENSVDERPAPTETTAEETQEPEVEEPPFISLVDGWQKLGEYDIPPYDKKYKKYCA